MHDLAMLACGYLGGLVTLWIWAEWTKRKE